MGVHDLVIIGAGPAGFSAGIYAARYKLDVLLVGREPGGQVNEAYEIDNYPGMMNIKGIDLSEKFKQHAERVGVKMELFSEVAEIKKKGPAFILKTDSGKELSARAVILAAGSRKRKLGLPGEDRLAGRGVSYCATCDAPFYKGKTVAVVGGGDTAVISAVMLAEHAKKVYLVYRKSFEQMRAVPYWKDAAKKNSRIKLVLDSVPLEFVGKGKLEAVKIKRGNKTESITVDGVFVEIGGEPASGLAKQLGAKLDADGFVVVGRDMSTNVPGFFAAGDVTNGSDHMEQIVTAAAEGAIAAKAAYNYLKKSG
jgi:thioredoxin reductase (NADPH)